MSGAGHELTASRVRRRAAVAAGGCGLGFLMTYVIAVLTVPGQWLDDEIFGLAQNLAIGPLQAWLPFVARRALPPTVLVVALVAGMIALSSRRWREIIMALAIVVGSVAPVPILRGVLPRPDHGYSYAHNTLPSTHVALVAALVMAIALLLVHRPVWLDRVLVGVVVLAWLGNVVGYAHRPSDVVASVLLVGTVAACVAFVAGPPRGRQPATNSHTAV